MFTNYFIFTTSERPRRLDFMSFKLAAQILKKTCLQILALSIFFLTESTQVFSQTNQAQVKNQSTDIKKRSNSSKKIRIYVHPTRKFKIAVPIGAELIERTKINQISIRSREGYAINIQAGDANPTLSLKQMISKLERKYLGIGKPWTHKISESPATIADLNAIKAKYDGAGTRAEVVIARGRITDLVIIFFAPIELFEKLEREFKWFLSNFRPYANEISMVNKKSKVIPTHKKESSHKLSPLKHFVSNEHGYSIKYPENWIMSKSADNTIASFNGKKETLASKVVVSIQNVRPPHTQSLSKVAEWALVEMKNSLKRDAKDFKVIKENSITFLLGKHKVSGKEIVATYSYSGNQYKRWSILIPRPDDTIAHIWSYTAPDTTFFKFQKIADSMLKSWLIEPSGG